MTHCLKKEITGPGSQMISRNKLLPARNKITVILNEFIVSINVRRRCSVRC